MRQISLYSGQTPGSPQRIDTADAIAIAITINNNTGVAQTYSVYKRYGDMDIPHVINSSIANGSVAFVWDSIYAQNAVGIIANATGGTAFGLAQEYLVFFNGACQLQVVLYYDD